MHVVSELHWTRLAAILRSKPEQAVGSGKELDQPFIDEIKERHPGLDRSALPERVAGVEVPDRWLQVVMLRGVQIMVAAAGYDVLLLGGLETPFLALHRNLQPFAVRTIPPDVEILVAPALSEEECQAITKAIEDGVSATRHALVEVAKDAPLAGDVFARRVWAACRAKTRPPSKEYDQRAERYVSLFRGQSHLQQLEMSLALSERVLTGERDKPCDRQIQATAADQMWRELGPIDWAQVDPVAATRGGWSRVASLAIHSQAERHRFIEHTKDAMARICQNDPFDLTIVAGSTVRVYRFHAGERTLIDRVRGRRGRVH